MLNEQQEFLRTLWDKFASLELRLDDMQAKQDFMKIKLDRLSAKNTADKEKKKGE